MTRGPPDSGWRHGETAGGGPGLLFERPTGYDIPVAVNLYGSMTRICMALGVRTLVIAGAHDEAMPSVWEPFVQRIPDARSHVFPESSHMPHVEEPDAFLEVVESFLRQHD